MVIRELLEFYNPHVAEQIDVSQEWKVNEAYCSVSTQRAWALEDRKWAKMVIEACKLVSLQQAVTRFDASPDNFPS